MTRFDANTPEERRSLVADTIVAHRERGSIFCTVEADTPPGGPIEAETTDPGESADDAAKESTADNAARGPTSDDAAKGPKSDDGARGPKSDDGARGPKSDDDAGELEGESDTPAWIQFSDSESQLNLDCTDEEYDRITDVLGTASAFTIDEQASPEDADGRNLRVTAYADPERVAAVVDRIFLEGFDYDDDYRLWATEI